MIAASCANTFTNAAGIPAAVIKANAWIDVITSNGLLIPFSFREI